ncbi:MAG: CAP domain-containing protein [Salinivirgaceae bacterium]|nr:CAP domain-containing protein [Salinivirgaceae bacterium]
MTLKYLLLASILFIVLFINDIEASYVSLYSSDTTITVKNCIKETTISNGSKTSTQKEFLDCFWETGTDTIISIENCLKTTKISKLGYERTITEKLPCFWDDATITADTFLLPGHNGKWRLNINTRYEKNGETKTGWSSDGIFEQEAYRAGLDTVAKIKYSSSHPVFKQYVYYEQYKDEVFSKRDTSIDIELMLKNVNELRADGCKCGSKIMYGTTPLKWSSKLEQVAFLYAKDMYERDFYSHTSPEGEGPGDRLAKQKIEASCGENIAQGQMNGEKAFRAWIESPGHCENMMLSRYTYIGVAKYMDRYCMLLTTQIKTKQ